MRISEKQRIYDKQVSVVMFADSCSAAVKINKNLFDLNLRFFLSSFLLIESDKYILN